MADHDDTYRRLYTQDPQFRQWTEEHHQHEDRLATLATKPALTPEEEIEEKTLKKRKLFLKDQMADRMRRYEAVST